MQRVSVGEDYTKRFVPRAIATIAALAGGEPDGEYRALVADCDSHAPWMWKDPRLWLTIRFWAPLLTWPRIRVLLLSRDPVQSWISCTQRRQIQTYKYSRRYNEAIQRSLDIMRERVDQLGVAEPEIQRSGSDQIVVSLPAVKNQQAAIQQVGTVAQLYFYSPVDPRLDWRTLETPHFYVHFAAPYRQQANLVAGVAEGVYPRITRLLSWEPRAAGPR
jgi:hypothetical protein